MENSRTAGPLGNIRRLFSFDYRVLPILLSLALVALPLFILTGSFFNSLVNKAALVIGSGFLGACAIYHVPEGNALFIPGKRLFAEESHMGMVSLFACFTLRLVLIIWNRLGLVHSLLLLAGCTAWAIVANAIRILFETFAEANWHFEAAYAVSGLAFVTALGLTLSCCHLLLLILGRPAQVLFSDSMALNVATPLPIQNSIWPNGASVLISDGVVLSGLPLEPRGLLGRWVDSINWRHLFRHQIWLKRLAAIPAGLAVVGLLICYLLRFTPDEIQDRYKAAGKNALAEKDYSTAEICFLRPSAMDNDHAEYRFQLALAARGLGQEERAESLLNDLTPSDRIGYIPA